MLRISPDAKPKVASSNIIGIMALGKAGLPLVKKPKIGAHAPQMSPNQLPHKIPAKNTGKCIGERDFVTLPAKLCIAEEITTANAQSIAVVTTLSVLNFFIVKLSFCIVLMCYILAEVLIVVNKLAIVGLSNKHTIQFASNVYKKKAVLLKQTLFVLAI